MMGLTPRQAATLTFIETSMRENGIAPSIKEIESHLDYSSKSGVIRILNCLEDRGFIRRRHRQARAIDLLKVSSVVICPHCGAIAGSAKCISAAKNATISYSGAKNPDLTIPDTAPTGGAVT